MDTNEQAPPEFGVRVFLVEDNPEHSFIAVTVIRQVLGDASEVIVAENADEAVELIQQFTDTDRPDLMLVDLRLPDNGGFAVSVGGARARPVLARADVRDHQLALRSRHRAELRARRLGGFVQAAVSGDSEGRARAHRRDSQQAGLGARFVLNFLEPPSAAPLRRERDTAASACGKVSLQFRPAFIPRPHPLVSMRRLQHEVVAMAFGDDLNSARQAACGQSGAHGDCWMTA